MTGFLLLLGPTGNALVIDLIAVDESMRGRGVAGAMIGFAARAFPDAGRVRVGTQAANVPSLRLYERLGFRTVATQYVVHSHWN